MRVTRIVGISLVKDEDLFVEQALRNVLGFCDELILADDGSRDGTLAILERLAAEQPEKVRLHRIANPSQSHDLISGYAGQDVWVFGVDGDELYDPKGLERFRPRLLGGEFDDWWLLRSNALHALELDEQRRYALGYLSPPAPSPVKLHNFALIESWNGRHPERLHGTEGLRFKPGAEARKLHLGESQSWETADLRVLHLCFVPRSSRGRAGAERANIKDMQAPRRWPSRVLRAARNALGQPPPSEWKAHYRQGDVAEVPVGGFFGD
jgi:glycosyltransferase involved in cell wall biosynthesis